VAAPAHTPVGRDTRVIALEGLRAGYPTRPNVLEDVSLHVDRGEIVTVLGHNGAGKTTMLKAIFGVLPISGGRILVDGEAAGRRSNVDSVRSGITLTPAEAPIFRDLTVRQNLDLGAYTVSSAEERRTRLAWLTDLFPLVHERRNQIAGTLSGGQQRIVSLGMALMARPRLMLLDEPSLGISPGLVKDIFAQVRELTRSEGLCVLLVEQNVRASLPVADRAYFMRAGRIILEEPAAVSLEREHWWELF
jgi:branched-chain amino acid transport system ATP-binding protein